MVVSHLQLGKGSKNCTTKNASAKLKSKDRIHHCFWQFFGLSLSYLMLKAVTIAFSWTCNYLEIEAKGCCEQWWALSNYFLPLRTMGSQNWWFGDARTILYGVKHPYRRSPIFLRIRTKKELFSGKRFLTPTNNALLNASCKVGATRDKSTYPTGFRGPHLHQTTLYNNPKLGKRQPCSDFSAWKMIPPHCKYWYHPKILGGKRKTNITYVSINMYVRIHTFICTLFKVYRTNFREYVL